MSARLVTGSGSDFSKRRSAPVGSTQRRRRRRRRRRRAAAAGPPRRHRRDGRRDRARPRREHELGRERAADRGGAADAGRDPARVRRRARARVPESGAAVRHQAARRGRPEEVRQGALARGRRQARPAADVGRGEGGDARDPPRGFGRSDREDSHRGRDGDRVDSSLGLAARVARADADAVERGESAPERRRGPRRAAMPPDDLRGHGRGADPSGGALAPTGAPRHRRVAAGGLLPRAQTPRARGAALVPHHPRDDVRREAARGEGPDDSAPATVAGFFLARARDGSRRRRPGAVLVRPRGAAMPRADGDVLREARGRRDPASSARRGDAVQRPRGRVRGEPRRRGERRGARQARSFSRTGPRTTASAR
jgi:hypothetical protein